MNLYELVKSINYAKAVPDIEISDISYNSLKCKEGDAFVCLRGATSDGHKYAVSAQENGAKVIIAEEQTLSTLPHIIVENTRTALATLSAEFFGNPSTKLKTIGITGTKGKTTTTYMMKSILENAGYKVGIMGTIGVCIDDLVIPTNNTTPENYEVQKYMALMVEKGCTHCVMEVSSIGLRENRVYGINFDVGVFTNFSEDHIGGVEHKDMEEYLKCKAMLFNMCKIGCLNADDQSINELLKNHSCEITTYGFSENSDVRGLNNKLLTYNGFIGSSLDVKEHKHAMSCEIGIPGKFNAYNALSAISACRQLGVDDISIKIGLRNCKVKGRVEKVEIPGNFTLLIDYAHNAVSMENILSTLREYNPTRLVCLFGAGGNRPRLRRFEMGEICGNMADLSVITEDNSRFEKVQDIIDDIKVGMAKTSGEFVEISDRRDAIKYCIQYAQDGDIIVLAGKGHEDYQELEGKHYPFDERVIIAEIIKELHLDDE